MMFRSKSFIRKSNHCIHILANTFVRFLGVIGVIDVTRYREVTAIKLMKKTNLSGFSNIFPILKFVH